MYRILVHNLSWLRWSRQSWGSLWVLRALEATLQGQWTENGPFPTSWSWSPTFPGSPGWARSFTRLSMNMVLSPSSPASLTGPQRHFKRPGREKLPYSISTLGYPKISNSSPELPMGITADTKKLSVSKQWHVQPQGYCGKTAMTEGNQYVLSLAPLWIWLKFI